MKPIYFLISFLIFTIVNHNDAKTKNKIESPADPETLRTLQTLSQSIPECTFKFVQLGVIERSSAWEQAWERADEDAKNRGEELLIYRNVTPRFKAKYAEREAIEVIEDVGALLDEEEGVEIWKKWLAKGRSDNLTLKKKDVDFYLKGDIRRARHRFCMWKIVNALLKNESTTILYMPVAVAYNEDVAPLWKEYVELKERKVEKEILDAQAIKLIDLEIEMVRQNRGSSMTTYVTIVGKDRQTILVEIASPQSPSIREKLGEEYSKIRSLVDRIKEWFSTHRPENVEPPPAYINLPSENPTDINNTKPIDVYDDPASTSCPMNDPDADLCVGDHFMSVSEAEAILKNLKKPDEKNVPKQEFKSVVAHGMLWPSRKISYQFESADQDWRQLIKSVLDHIDDQTCIRFKENGPKDKGYIRFVMSSNSDKCFTDKLGYDGMGGEGTYRQVEIGQHCAIIHEVLHVLGLEHEHNRNDRDNYIWINWPEIPENKLIEYQTLTDDYRGQPYDLGSIMHYQSRDLVNDIRGRKFPGNLKIVTKERPYQWTPGQRNEMSFKDAKLINELYCLDECPKNINNCKNGGYTDPNDCKHCRCPEGYATHYGCTNLEKHEMEDCGNFTVLSAWSHRSKLRVKIRPNITGKCYWKITMPSSLERIVLKVKQISFTGKYDYIACGQNDTNYLEIKYKQDKVPTGARICDNTIWMYYQQARPGLTQLTINADDKTDVILIMKLTAGGTTDQSFELTYRALKNGSRRIVDACNCRPVRGLFDAALHKSLGGQELDVKKLALAAPHCAGQKGSRALVEVKCKKNANITINGIYGNYIPVPGEDESFVLNQTKLALQCKKYADSTLTNKIHESFWTFTDPKTNRLILVDDILCLPNLPEGCKNPYCYERRPDPIGVETGETEDEDYYQGEDEDYSEEGEED